MQSIQWRDMRSLSCPGSGDKVKIRNEELTRSSRPELETGAISRGISLGRYSVYRFEWRLSTFTAKYSAVSPHALFRSLQRQFDVCEPSPAPPSPSQTPFQSSLPALSSSSSPPALSSSSLPAYSILSYRS